MRIDYSESLEKKRRCSEKIDFFVIVFMKIWIMLGMWKMNA